MLEGLQGRFEERKFEPVPPILHTVLTVMVILSTKKSHLKIVLNMSLAWSDGITNKNIFDFSKRNELMQEHGSILPE
jgi:hypothetical protein